MLDLPKSEAANVDSSQPTFEISNRTMGLWTLLEACLIFVNALAIIDEERFLKPRACHACASHAHSRSRCSLRVCCKVGFVADVNGIGGADAGGAGSKLVELLRAIRTVMTSNRPRTHHRHRISPHDPHAFSSVDLFEPPLHAVPLPARLSATHSEVKTRLVRPVL